jgi:phosphoglycerate dehydrogenase-like enzyme
VPTRVFNLMGPAAQQLAADFPDVEFVDVSDGAPPDRDAEVLFGGWADEKVLPLLDRGVRWIQLPGTGIDGVTPAVLARVPLVTCARGASAVPISEYVLAVMLAFAKGFPGHWISEPPPHWNFQRMDTLAGKTVGLIGLGGIGSAIATRAQAFGMRVVAMRRTAAPSPVPGVEIVTGLDALLPEADHLVIAAPATPRTRGLLDAAAFARVKPGVHLVNIARGAIVDQDALRAALDDGRVARASLDTVDPEPLPAGHWLYGHDRVLLTPHSSWASSAILDAALEIFAANLRRYVAGEPLQHLVDLDEGY